MSPFRGEQRPDDIASQYETAHGTIEFVETTINKIINIKSGID
jgi:hypothetical protein